MMIKDGKRMLVAGETGAPSLFKKKTNLVFLARISALGKYLRRLRELEVWGREEAGDRGVVERNWVESSPSESYEAGELGQ